MFTIWRLLYDEKGESQSPPYESGHSDSTLRKGRRGIGRHPPPHTGGSRGGLPGGRSPIHPLAVLQLSKSRRLLGWILEQSFRGALVYGRIGSTVEAVADSGRGNGVTRPGSWAGRLSACGVRLEACVPAFRGERLASGGV
jgi:hypothetical protein